MIKSTKSVISGIVFCFVVIFSTNIFSADLKFNTQDFAPFSYAIDGIVSGPVVEIIAETCKEIEINCTYNLMMWKTAQRPGPSWRRWAKKEKESLLQKYPTR